MNFKIKESEYKYYIPEERFDYFSDIAFESLTTTGDVKLTAEYLTKECKSMEELFAVGFILGKSEAFFQHNSEAV